MRYLVDSRESLYLPQSGCSDELILGLLVVCASDLGLVESE